MSEEQSWNEGVETPVSTDPIEVTVTGAAGAGALPIEPAADPDSKTNPDEVRDALLRFYLYGQRSDGAASASDPTPIPALFHSYRDLTRVRHDYPICVNGSDLAYAFRPLTLLVDETLEAMTPEGDERERLRRYLYRIEAAIKNNPGGDLGSAWSAAADSVLSSSDLDEDRREALRDHLERAKDELPTGSRLIDCDAATAELLFRELAAAHWRSKSAAWKDELDSLIVQLGDILDTDQSRSQEARSPRHLSESLAESELDVDALSSIISTKGGDGMSARRRHRIEDALETLTRLRAVFGLGEETDEAPFDWTRVVTTSADAIAEHEKRMKAMVAFFKAVHIATLEAGNHYREPVHDAFFETFGTGHLTEKEFSLCPPVLLHITPESLTNTEAAELIDVLGSGVPVKALVEVDDLIGEPKSVGPSVAVWPTRLGRAAMAIGEVFVAQAPISRARDLQSRFVDGFDFGGPALFVVFVGKDDEQPVSRYLMAEAAAESRLFPTFTFDPGKGETCLDRMGIATNSDVERDWPVESLKYLTVDGEEADVAIAFTPGDFLACDRRFDELFWHVDRSHWHDSMMPLSDYVEGRGADEGEAIPYIVTVGADSRLGRAVVTRGVVATTIDARMSWRSLQEHGGVNNSFAQRLLSVEKERLAEAKAGEVKAIEENYAAQLDQDLGDLTKEIVQRIVNGLLTQEGLSAAPTTEVTPRPAPKAPAAPAAAEAAPVETKPAEVEEPEEELGSFDDPYIDTPLCTSCNECTQLNPRMFAYNENKQAFIKDATAGTFEELVKAAEVCPVHIIHPGKPKDPNEPGLDELIERAAPFN